VPIESNQSGSNKSGSSTPSRGIDEQRIGEDAMRFINRPESVSVLSRRRGRTSRRAREQEAQSLGQALPHS
jgi:hypothetical protein